MGRFAGLDRRRIGCLVFLGLIGVVCLLVIPRTASATSQTPIAAYSFDAGEGAVAEDLTGNEHEATIEGATWTTGKYGKALSFDGENDCLSVPESAQLQFLESEEFTLEAWVRPSAEGLGAIITQEDEAGGEEEEPFSYTLLSGAGEEAPRGWLRRGGEEGHEGVGAEDPLPESTWSHLAFTDDGARMRIYVDGELAGTEPAIPLTAASGPLTIGCLASFGNYFKGKIDEVQVYDRALDGGEVLADQNGGLQTPPSPVIAAYAFDEAEGEVAHDYAGGHDGTIEGASWTRGRFGSALEFDAAEEDLVTIPTSADLDLEDFTLEAWVKPRELGQLMPILAKANGEGYGYGLYAAGDGEPPLPDGIISEGEYVDVYAVGEEPLSLKAWTHIAVTSDGNKMRFYVDGKLVDTRTGHNVIAGGEAPLTIGGAEAFLPGEFFDGKIDEVRLYGRALGEGEITSDMHTGIETPSAGPIAAYSFDAGEGAVAEDITGNKHEGTIEGATWTANGKYGKALSFDGENDCVQVPDSAELQLSEEFTLEAWVRPDHEQEFVPIFYKEAEGFYSYSLYLGVFEKGALEGFVTDEEPGWAEVSSHEPLPSKTWTHVAFTSDGAHLRLYVNGELVDQGSARDVKESEGPLYLGCFPGSEQFFKGKIDEVRIYDRALDGQEVRADQNAAIQMPPSPVIAAYSFDENEGTVAHDYAGGHDGTIEGANWTKGRFGSALEFDAEEEDVVTIPTSPDLDLEDFTLEAWVKPQQAGEMPVLAKGEGEGYGYGLYAATDAAGYITNNEAVEAYAVSGGESTPLKAWAHIAVTSDGDKLRFYVNGQLVDERSGANVISGGEAPLLIGGSHSFVPAEFFKGRIDNVRLYGRALNEGEITSDMHTGIETPSAGPIAAYSFDAGEGAVAEDITGNKHEGTIEGATWTANGKYGKALSFDGENDCVQVPDSAELQLSEEFTLEAWVRPDHEQEFVPIFYKEAEGFYSYSLYLGVFEKGALEGFVTDEEPGWAEVSSHEPLPSKTWTHVAFTSDGAHLRLYVNGELVDQGSARDVKESEGPLYLGCFPGSEQFFKGKIDEVRIYDRALDGQEVRPDVTPPGQPSEIEVTSWTEEPGESSYVTWTSSIDPTFSDGYHGSGLAGYHYQYHLGSEAWSPVTATVFSAFEIPETTEGDHLAVKVWAVDVEGNSSPIKMARLETIPSTLGPDNIGASTNHEEAGDLAAEPWAQVATGSGIDGPPLNPSEIDPETEHPCPPIENPCGKFSPHDAERYIYDWTFPGKNSEYVDIHHNQAFQYYGSIGGDCTNFASQVLWAGGMKFVGTRGRNTPAEVGNKYSENFGSWFSGWYEEPGEKHRHRLYNLTSNFPAASKLYRHLIKSHLGIEIKHGPLRPGDLIFEELHLEDKPNEIDHTQIVTRVTPNKIWIAQHSQAYIVTLRYDRNHNLIGKHGEQGVGWEWHFIRPVHTKFNLDELGE
jgi:membrane protein implicated in regulation of membrane protease activity